MALSFAGEKRDFVATVARLLANRFGEDRILYDKFHEAEFARYDLGVRLPELYGAQSDLIVPILCPAYDAKRWTGWEWIHIYGLLTKEDGHRVMPCRFELAHADGLSPASAFIELDDKTPAQFETLILERLALNEGRSRDYYLATGAATGLPPRTSIPHNLPALQPFFGREQELRRIADALEPESRTWGALIDGPGGMGKTSLAVRAAYDVPADTFDRIVFVSLKSRELDDDGIRDLSGFLISGLAELFNELARELGRGDIAKAVESQRPRLLLDALRGTRVLLVLDNLESLTKPDRDTVFTFVKRLPPGCKAILTSRGRIGSAAEELILEKLSEDAALATLAALAETNPTLARTNEAERLVLYRETGGKPLLLRWTAGQMGRGSCVTFADAIAHLRSCPGGNDPLEFIFGDLVGDFSQAETEALCALTYFTLPARAEHIAGVAGRLQDPDVTQALKSLINRSLVVPSEELNTFTLVPLVADFLRVRKPDVVTETGSRLEKHAFALAVENGHRNYARFPVLDAAWPTVAAALPGFIKGDNDRLQTLCRALDEFLTFTGRWDEQSALSLDAERRAEAAGAFESAGRRAYDAGWIHMMRGESAGVLACADRAEVHWRKAGRGAEERAMTIHLRGIGHSQAGNNGAALSAYREAVELARAVNRESHDVAVYLNDVAGSEADSGDLLAAERDYREALRIARAIGDQKGEAIYTGNLANLELRREEWDAGAALAREALQLSEQVGHLEVIADHSHTLAVALMNQDRRGEALPLARRAVEIYRKLRKDVARYERTLADCQPR
ncbi:MAG: tetratricopeptide repeat protein [Vicinamibacterales bacterium]